MADSGSYPFSNQAHHNTPGCAAKLSNSGSIKSSPSHLRSASNCPPTGVLCDTLQVSRTATREAISVLSQGIVASKPGEGSTVQPLSQWMLLDPEVLNWLRESDMASSIIEHLLEVRAHYRAGSGGTRLHPRHHGTVHGTGRRPWPACRRERPSAPEKASRAISDFHNRILDISATSFWPAYAISAWYRWS